MIYACSDLHGCYDKYIKLLEYLPLKDEDTLYICGDVLDRGPDGIRILQDIMKRKNVILLMGNHEDMAYFTIKLLTDSRYEKGDPQVKEFTDLWLHDNGGKPTWNAYKKLSPAQQTKIRCYIRNLPLYQEVTVDGKNFFSATRSRPRLKCSTIRTFRRSLFSGAKPNMASVISKIKR